MKMILDDSEVELSPITIISEDKGLVIISKVGERGIGKDELTKEIIANDALVVGPTLAAQIHNVNISTASKYKDGLDVKEETRKVILNKRNGIADTAVDKLMESLQMFEPSDIEKPLDRIRAAHSLASIVEKMTPNSKTGDNEIHLHLYAPKQRPLKEYDVIEVS